VATWRWEGSKIPPNSQTPLLYAAAIVIPAIVLAARFTPVRATPRRARHAAAINILAVVVVAAFLQLRRVLPVGWAAFVVLMSLGAWLVASMFIFGVSRKPWHRDDG
jgi:hypothetical protein